MNQDRTPPASARLVADCLILALVILGLMAVVIWFPKAPSKPRFPPQSERLEPQRLPR